MCIHTVFTQSVITDGDKEERKVRIDSKNADQISRKNLMQMLDKYSDYKWNYAKQIRFDSKMANLWN